MIDVKLGGRWDIAKSFGKSALIVVPITLAVRSLQERAEKLAIEQIEHEIYGTPEPPRSIRTSRTLKAIRRGPLSVKGVSVSGSVKVDKRDFTRYYAPYAELGTSRQPPKPYWRQTQKQMKRAVKEEAMATAISMRASLLGR